MRSKVVTHPDGTEVTIQLSTVVELRLYQVGFIHPFDYVEGYIRQRPRETRIEVDHASFTTVIAWPSENVVNVDTRSR